MNQINLYPICVIYSDIFTWYNLYLSNIRRAFHHIYFSTYLLCAVVFLMAYIFLEDSPPALLRLKNEIIITPWKVKWCYQCHKLQVWQQGQIYQLQGWWQDQWQFLWFPPKVCESMLEDDKVKDKQPLPPTTSLSKVPMTVTRMTENGVKL